MRGRGGIHPSFETFFFANLTLIPAKSFILQVSKSLKTHVETPVAMFSYTPGKRRRRKYWIAWWPLPSLLEGKHWGHEGREGRIIEGEGEEERERARERERERPIRGGGGNKSKDVRYYSRRKKVLHFVERRKSYSLFLP